MNPSYHARDQPWLFSSPNTAHFPTKITTNSIFIKERIMRNEKFY